MFSDKSLNILPIIVPSLECLNLSILLNVWTDKNKLFILQKGNFSSKTTIPNNDKERGRMLF